MRLTRSLGIAGGLGLVAITTLAACGGAIPSVAPATPLPSVAPSSAPVSPTPATPPAPTPVVVPSPPDPVPTESPFAGASFPGGPGCPDAVTQIADVAAVPAADRPGCFGSVDLTFVAYAPSIDMDVADCPASAGLKIGACTADPVWLIGAYVVLAGDTSGDPMAPDALVVALDPAGTARRVADPGWVHVEGHFDDPAAATCRITVKATGKPAEPPKTTVRRCRETFVATAIDPAGAP